MLAAKEEKRELLHRKWEEQIFKKANAVFVHKDKDGNEVGGEIQGLDLNKRFKGTVGGTGETFFKFVPVKDARPVRAFIFESAIDLMSFYSMCNDKSKLKGTMLVSMAGLKNFVVEQLREQGLNVISAVDNDEAGRRFEKITSLTSYLTFCEIYVSTSVCSISAIFAAVLTISHWNSFVIME